MTGYTRRGRKGIAEGYQEIIARRKMKYAPIMIPTLCRYEQFKNCIESLQNNQYAKETELFIGLDYPLKKEHEEGHKKIEQYIERGISGFSKVIVIKQTRNLGWSKNFEILRNRIYLEHDMYIYTEDDNVFSKNFLCYMNLCLEKYKEDNKILAVSGYSYPAEWNVHKDNIIFLNTYFAAWGYGIWREKEEKMRRSINLEIFNNWMKNYRICKKIYYLSPNQFCNFVKGMVGYTDMLVHDEKLMNIDLAYGIYMMVNDLYMVFPIISKSRNTGHGNGMNCNKIEIDLSAKINHRNYSYEKQTIDEEEGFKIKFLGEVSTGGTKAEKKFFKSTLKERILCWLTWGAYNCLGRDKMVKIIQKGGKNER